MAAAPAALLGSRHVAAPCSIILPQNQPVLLRVSGDGEAEAALLLREAPVPKGRWCGAGAGAATTPAAGLTASDGCTGQPKNGNGVRAMLPYEAVQCHGSLGSAVGCCGGHAVLQDDAVRGFAVPWLESSACSRPGRAPQNSLGSSCGQSHSAPWEASTQLQSLLTPSHSCDWGRSAQKPRPCLGVTCSESSVPAAGDGELWEKASQLHCAPALLWDPQIGYNLQQHHPLPWSVLLMCIRMCLSYCCFISPSCVEVSGTSAKSYC